MRLFLIVVVGLGGVCSATAQGALTLAPDTLIFPAETVVAASNPSTTPARLDSLSVAFAGPRAWHLDVEVSDTTFGSYYFNAERELSTAVGLSVEAGATVLLRLTGFDPCIVCKRGGSALGADTLYVYAEGEAEPGRVVIDLSTYVANEPERRLPQSFVVEVYPSPAGERVTVRLGTDRLAEARFALVDVAGRVVHRQSAVAGRQEYELAVDTLPPGLYFVRVSAGNAPVAVQPLVVAR